MIWSHRCEHWRRGLTTEGMWRNVALSRRSRTFPVFPCFYILSRLHFHKGDHSLVLPIIGSVATEPKPVKVFPVCLTFRVHCVRTVNRLDRVQPRLVFHPLRDSSSPFNMWGISSGLGSAAPVAPGAAADHDSISTAAPRSLPGPVRTDRGPEGRGGLQHSVPLQLSHAPHDKFRSAALTLQSTSWEVVSDVTSFSSQTRLMGTILSRMSFPRPCRCAMMTDCGGWEQISTDTAAWAWKHWLRIIQQAHLQRWSGMHFLYTMIVIPVLADAPQRS